MRRYVLTGAPGAGKTSVLRALPGLGLAIVEEAATDVIAGEQHRGVDEPWREDGFIDKIVSLQRERQQNPATPGGQPATAGGQMVQVHDRSVLCTLALARFLNCPITALLAGEVERVTRERTFQSPVFLIRPLGFVERTAARRISYQDSLMFEKLHEQAYREHGFEIVNVPADGAAQRAAMIAGLIVT